MEKLTREQLLARTRASERHVDELTAAGILDPTGDGFSVGDLRRLNLIQACLDAGLPLEGIMTAVRDGKLSFAFLDLPSFRLDGASDRTYAEVAAAEGLDVGFLLSVVESLGFPRPSPGERVHEEDLELLPAARASLSAGLTPEVILRVLRVWGEGLRRITEAEGWMYHNYIEMPLLRSGMSERDMRAVASQFSEAVIPVIDRALLGVYHRHQEQDWLRDLVEHVESALEEAGIHEQPDLPPAMCFLDVTGYSTLTDERGDEAAAELAAAFTGLVHQESQRHGGKPVKWLGDGVMIYFAHPEQAVIASLDLAERVPAAGLPPVHVGIDAGPLIHQEGDYYGRTVNVAARIGAYAGPDQVLVSDRVVEVAQTPSFREIGAVDLKGLTRPVNLYEALRSA